MTENNETINNVLVVIDPAKDTQYALKRAIKMNEILEGGINIYLFISLEMDELRKNNDKFEFHCSNSWFADLVKPLVEANIKFTADVFWTADWHNSVLGAVKRNDIDMVILSDHSENMDGSALSAAKWSLLRSSTCPVLLVYPHVELHRKTILAAVNMQTENPRYVDLNNKILKLARMMSKSYGAEKHIVNAYEDSLEFPDRAKLIRDTGAKQENIHVEQGSPGAIIANVANKIGADVVIIGTLSRRGILAAMRGNKSEEIIRKLNRDVIILN
ncbi:MAG: universal stress protein [Emcibacter sp.]|nr:universal stress protein [Emcibacter sp.]